VFLLPITPDDVKGPKTHISMPFNFCIFFCQNCCEL
jgi:hypothetical protein